MSHKVIHLRDTTVFSTIKLSQSQGVPNEVQVLRCGKFSHPVYGEFEITEQVLSEMKQNFDQKIRGIDISFDYYHDSGEDASAWVTDLELREQGQELWARVDWTPKAQQKLADRELRYFSPDFAFQWSDPETNKTWNNVLFGGGLTNRPFVKEMQAIVASEENQNRKGESMTELEKARAELKAAQDALKLSEEKGATLSADNAALQKKVAAAPPPTSDPDSAGDTVESLKKKLADMTAQLDAANKEKTALMAEKDKMSQEKVLAEKGAAFNVLLSEGKACVAQKDAFIKGDMTEFIKLAQPVNLRANGSGTSSTPATETDEKAILKLAEEKQKANPKLSRGDAVSLALRESKQK